MAKSRGRNQLSGGMRRRREPEMKPENPACQFRAVAVQSNVFLVAIMKCIALVTILAGWIPFACAQSTIAHFNGPAFPVHAIYSDPQGIDFDGDGMPEFNFWSDGLLCTADVPTSFCVSSFCVGASATNMFLVNGDALVQSAGALISSNASTGAAWSTAQPYGTTLTANWWSLHGRMVGEEVVYSGWDGSLGILTNAFLGVRFQSPDGLHYGWIRVRLPNAATASEGTSYEIVPVVVEWAFETRPDTTIIAGAKPVTVPLTAPDVVRPAQLRLKWPSTIGKAYQVQAKANLTLPLWTNLDFVVIGSATYTTVSIPMAGTALFFRVVEAD